MHFTFHVLKLFTMISRKTYRRHLICIFILTVFCLSHRWHFSYKFPPTTLILLENSTEKRAVVSSGQNVQIRSLVPLLGAGIFQYFVITSYSCSVWTVNVHWQINRPNSPRKQISFLTSGDWRGNWSGYQLGKRAQKLAGELIDQEARKP